MSLCSHGCVYMSAIFTLQTTKVTVVNFNIVCPTGSFMLPKCPNFPPVAGHISLYKMGLLTQPHSLKVLYYMNKPSLFDPLVLVFSNQKTFLYQEVLLEASNSVQRLGTFK